MEKKIQNKIKGVNPGPFVRHIRKTIKKAKSKFISIAAARESKCLTSEGKGRNRLNDMACGVFLRKLRKLGSSFSTSTSDPPLMLK